MRGSIKLRYKGHGKKDPDSWRLIYDVRDETGARKRRWVTVRGTKKDAEEKMAEILASINANTYVDTSKMTLGQWLPKWLDLAKER